jgi:hypothetical protein
MGLALTAYLPDWPDVLGATIVLTNEMSACILLIAGCRIIGQHRGRMKKASAGGANYLRGLDAAGSVGAVSRRRGRFPADTSVGLQVDLELLECRPFPNGCVFVSYCVKQ